MLCLGSLSVKYVLFDGNAKLKFYMTLVFVQTISSSNMIMFPHSAILFSNISFFIDLSLYLRLNCIIIANTHLFRDIISVI